MQNHIEELSRKIASEKENVKNEAATINAFVMPFLELLGYDIRNPREVVPEYLADLSMKGDCVDLAILKNGIPQILVECKYHNLKLNKHVGQLNKYFASLPMAKLGILTNGIDYWFYTDSEKPNVMDSEPFLKFSLENPDSVPCKVLSFFSKSSYTPKVLSRLRVVSNLKKGVLQELSTHYGELAHFVLSDLSEKLAYPLKTEPPPLVIPGWRAEALQLIQNALSPILSPDRIVIHKEYDSWFSVAILLSDDSKKSYRLVAEVQFNEKSGKKWLAMNPIHLKRNIEAVSDISKYKAELLESARAVMKKHRL